MCVQNWRKPFLKTLTDRNLLKNWPCTFTALSVPTFKYYNRNPDGEHIKDCVCRAISTATGLYYDAVDNLLNITASRYECDKLCVCCYENLLSDILCYPCTHCEFAKTVEEVVKAHPTEKLIIRVDAHLTSSLYGTVLDIWNCSDELVDCYWVIL